MPNILAKQEPDQSDIEKIHALHIHYQRARDTENSCYYFHELLKRLPSLTRTINLFTGHVTAPREQLRLGVDFLKAYPESRLPYLFVAQQQANRGLHEQACEMQ